MAEKGKNGAQLALKTERVLGGKKYKAGTIVAKVTMAGGIKIEALGKLIQTNEVKVIE